MATESVAKDVYVALSLDDVDEINALMEQVDGIVGVMGSIDIHQFSDKSLSGAAWGAQRLLGEISVVLKRGIQQKP